MMREENVIHDQGKQQPAEKDDEVSQMLKLVDKTFKFSL